MFDGFAPRQVLIFERTLIFISNFDRGEDDGAKTAAKMMPKVKTTILMYAQTAIPS